MYVTKCTIVFNTSVLLETRTEYRYADNGFRVLVNITQPPRKRDIVNNRVEEKIK